MDGRVVRRPGGQTQQRFSPDAQACKMMGDVVREQRAAAIYHPMYDVETVFVTAEQDMRRYDSPTGNEIAAIVVCDDADDQIVTPSYMAVRSTNTTRLRLQTVDGDCGPMVYPILFPFCDKWISFAVKTE